MKATFARPRSKLCKADKWFYAFSASLILSSLLAYTYPSLQIVHKVYVHQKLKVDTRKQREKQNRLKLKYESLISNREMETLAMNDGFDVPENGSIIYVRKIR